MMRTFLFSSAVLIGLTAVAQTLQESGLVSANIQSVREAGQPFRSVGLVPSSIDITSIAGLSRAVETPHLFTLDLAGMVDMLADRPLYVTLEIPSAEGTLLLDLQKVDITASGFVVTRSSDEAVVSYTEGAHYRGMLRGSTGSLAAVSFFEGELMAMITDRSGTQIIGRVKNDSRGLHVMYRETNLTRRNNPKCDTPDDGLTYTSSQIEFDARGGSSDCVRLYWEVNYDIYQDKGSIANATNYVTGLFNQSATLFANDGISVVLSQVYVWNTASPYTGSSTNALLSQFQAFRNSFNGDLAHLLGYVGNGGVAAGFAGLCNGNIDLRMCYSDIDDSYDIVPDYSWSVNVVTHEQGHLLGSRHTHACVWNGNSTAIDDRGNGVANNQR